VGSMEGQKVFGGGSLRTRQHLSLGLRVKTRIKTALATLISTPIFGNTMTKTCKLIQRRWLSLPGVRVVVF
jgi:hypothetical protein